jgi:BarA-like signal transduction histidine kinase
MGARNNAASAMRDVIITSGLQVLSTCTIGAAPRYVLHPCAHNVRIPRKSNYTLIQLQTKNQSNMSQKLFEKAKCSRIKVKIKRREKCQER